MKVKKYSNDKTTRTLAQKLEAYQASGIGIPIQKNRTAAIFATGGLAMLTPFVSQAQCTITPADSGAGSQLFVDVNGDGNIDIGFYRNIGTRTISTFSGSTIFTNRITTSDFEARGSGGLTIKVGRFFGNSVISAGGGLAALGLCKNGGTYFSGSWCGQSGFLGIQLSTGERGFIQLAVSSTAPYFSVLGGGVSDTPNPTQDIIAGDCNSLVAPLPVELVSFTAKAAENHVALQWKTASELNNDRFEIERSKDGISFETIGTVNGNGTTNEEQDYAYYDRTVVDGIYYYRLKQVDYDGKFEKSQVVQVRMSGAQNAVSVFPTVIKDQINIQTDHTERPTVVSDVTGRILRTYAATPNTIDVSDLKAGVYVVLVGDQAVRVVKPQ